MAKFCKIPSLFPFLEMAKVKVEIPKTSNEREIYKTVKVKMEKTEGEVG